MAKIKGFKPALKLFLLILALELHAQNLITLPPEQIQNMRSLQKSILRFQTHITPQARYLGDLLMIKNDTQHWAKIPLDSSPKAGERINKNQVINWVQNKTGSTNIQWQGRNTATIEQETQSTGKELLSRAKAELIHELNKKTYSHIELIAQTIPKDSEIPLSSFIVQIPHKYPPTHRICMRLNYKKHSIPIWFRVKAYQKILVARHRIKQHSSIQKDDFILKNRNIAGLKYEPYTTLPQQFWLIKSINKNQILTSNHLAKIPQIIKGQSVAVKVINQDISLIIHAIAQQDGYLGQKIKMKNPTSNKDFVAVVRAANQAEIKL